MTSRPAAQSPTMLKRQLGVFGATTMGMGSIVGTGVFVSIGIAAGITGPAVVLAIVIAAGLALCNALSSAQLGQLDEARNAFHALDIPAGWLGPIAVIAALVLTAIVSAGIRRANWTNILIVSVTLGALAMFVVAGTPTLLGSGRANLTPFFSPAGESTWQDLRGLLHAAALMFVAYTGYGRIATLGEEVREPRRTIPRAILTTLVLSALLYVAVSIVAVGTLGAQRLSAATESEAALLEIAAEQFRWPWIHWLVAVGAVTAMLSVLLNLILGLSRVLLAMGRRRDMPGIVARLDRSHHTPFVAVIVVGIVIAGLAASIGSVKTTWSFSAFTVLVYYAITNLSALRLKRPERLYPVIFAWCGLAGCLFLAFWVEWRIWLVGLGLIAIGLVWHRIANVRRVPGLAP